MILDIKTLADTLTRDIRETVSGLTGVPHLTIIRVGENSASEVYVRNKIKTCESVGIQATLLHLEDKVTQEALAAHIQELNTDRNVHGILVQSPLPGHIDAQKIFDTIDPKKDVDGFSSTNIARLYSGDESGLVPGTPKGIMKICEAYFQMKNEEWRMKNGGLLKNSGTIHSDKGEEWNMGGLLKKLEWSHAVVIGKSTIVGKPLAMLLLHAGATVTICHSRTRDLASHTKNADIVISAVGKKHLITADMIRPGALVVDVGINVEGTEDVRKIYGDCDTDGIGAIADVTPVPRWVGPMTIAMLLSNVLAAYQLQWNR